MTYANVMATIAVFLVLSGGTAVALTGSNTVFTDDIVNGEVKAADIGSNAVGSSKIVDGGVQSADIYDGAVDSPDILDGAVSNNDVRKNAITSGKVQDESLAGTDVLNDSLTGLDVVESSLGKVPSASSADSASSANSLNGKTAAELEGARASAIVLGDECNASGFCPILRGRRVAYAYHVAKGKYCVGVNGIPATDASSFALVMPASYPLADPPPFAYWRGELGSNVNCVGTEWEIYTGIVPNPLDISFKIVIP